MAHLQASLQIEIQYLKGALVLSQKKADQYVQLGVFDHQAQGSIKLKVDVGRSDNAL